jgi:hypothetical protein
MCMFFIEPFIYVYVFGMVYVSEMYLLVAMPEMNNRGVCVYSHICKTYL